MTSSPTSSISGLPSSLQGSSYLQLPRPFAWAIGNTNFHHVHHLSAKIPNYHLRAAHERHSMFEQTPVVTIRSSLSALRLKLWDDDRRALVPFPRRAGYEGSPAPSIVAASSTK